MFVILDEDRVLLHFVLFRISVKNGKGKLDNKSFLVLYYARHLF